MGFKYRSNDKMSDLINDNYRLLQVMSRFGISLGFGDKTVQEVCTDNDVNCETFLAVCNFIVPGEKKLDRLSASVSVRSLLKFLRQSHTWFLDFMLPSIRRKLVTALDCSSSHEVTFLIMRFFDEYVNEVYAHMSKENETFFGYVDTLLEGKRPSEFNLSTYKNDVTHPSHEGMNQKLEELKSVIIRYCPAPGNKDLLTDALYDIFSFNEDLNSHHAIEESLFIPAVLYLESHLEVTEEEASSSGNASDDKTPLSGREKDVIKCLVKGMTNKEIADALFISIHTVLTHRRNIAQKLEIHSSAGLIIYAIVNGIVDINDIEK